MIYDLTCPIHGSPLGTVEEKPAYKAKCLWKQCPIGVLAGDDTNQIIDPTKAQ